MKIKLSDLFKKMIKRFCGGVQLTTQLVANLTKTAKVAIFCDPRTTIQKEFKVYVCHRL